MCQEVPAISAYDREFRAIGSRIRETLVVELEADMTETFTKWDAAEHLRTREDARLYVQACAEEDPGDGSLIRAALNDVARAGNMSGAGSGRRHEPRGAL